MRISWSQKCFSYSCFEALKAKDKRLDPVPHYNDNEKIDAIIDQAVREADEKGVHGKDSTPFLLAKIVELTGGESLKTNIQLVYNNAKLGAQIAKEYQEGK